MKLAHDSIIGLLGVDLYLSNKCDGSPRECYCTALASGIDVERPNLLKPAHRDGNFLLLLLKSRVDPSIQA